MPIFKKQKTYGKQVDINALTQAVANRLQQEKWKVQQRVEGNRGVVQAQKAGILRDLIAADRALTFTFEQVPNGTSMNVGVSKWVRNIGVMAVETLFLSSIFLPLDISEILWTDHVEKGVIAEIDSIINSM
jgi:hypothetical protein